MTRPQARKRTDTVNDEKKNIALNKKQPLTRQAPSKRGEKGPLRDNKQEENTDGRRPRFDITDKTYLARGKRGIAYTAKLGKRTVLVKERNPESVVDTVAHEAQMLALVNTRGVGPLFIAHQDGALIREFVDGEEMESWIPHATAKSIKLALLEVLRQCRAMDLLGVDKLEMTHPHKHVLITHGGPRSDGSRSDSHRNVVMIDFDRARRTARPKNVTQVCQWISGGRMRTLIEPKGISIDRAAMLAHAKAYKLHYDAQSYERILAAVRDA
ncbi:TPA: hypothetical protein HA251_06170 [Candidatus Woesearchaeota archaeon]|nr:hypothetical protein [Candidatus Woesearchaeota archaeon]